MILTIVSFFNNIEKNVNSLHILPSKHKKVFAYSIFIAQTPYNNEDNCTAKVSEIFNKAVLY